MNIRPDFTKAELECKCGCGQMVCKPASLDKLQALRYLVGKPLTISSAYRCPTYNALVSKHAKSSAHLTGNAFDIKCSGKLAAAVLEAALKVGFTRIGIAQKGAHKNRFIHVDDSRVTGFSPWVWSY